MKFFEFKRRLNLLNEDEKKFVYQLTLVDAVNFLKTIQ